jgi:poly-D-alanine transfer protein DltD
MDNYVQASHDQQFLNNLWEGDWADYQGGMHDSHDKMDWQIHKAWEKNGKKSVEFLDSALEDAKEIK